MIEALRSEWIKFSTLRSNWVMVVIAVAFPLVIVGLTAAFSASPPSGSDLAELIAGTGVVSALLLGALAILSITAEYGHNTIRPTFAALPDRWRALGAKPIAHIGLTAAAMAGIVVIGWLLGSSIAEDEQALDGEATRIILVGIVLLAIGLTLLGFGLGSLLRSTPLAICVLLLWPLLVEGLLAGLLTVIGWDGALRWLPYQAGFEMINRFPDDDSLGRVGGGLWFFAWVVAIMALGLWRSHRRDA